MGKIVVAAEGPKIAQNIFERAVNTAREANAEIILLNAIDIDKRGTYWLGVQHRLEEELKAEAKENAAALASHAAGIKVRSVVVAAPLDMAVHALTEQDADISLVILSAHKRHHKRIQSKVACPVTA